MRVDLLCGATQGVDRVTGVEIRHERIAAQVAYEIVVKRHPGEVVELRIARRWRIGWAAIAAVPRREFALALEQLPDNLGRVGQIGHAFPVGVEVPAAVSRPHSRRAVIEIVGVEGRGDLIAFPLEADRAVQRPLKISVRRHAIRTGR